MILIAVLTKDKYEVRLDDAGNWEVWSKNEDVSFT